MRTLVAVTLFFAMTLTVDGTASAQTVKAVDGNIIYIAPNGSQRHLTSTGLDSQPSLSFDGKRVVFVRNTPDFKGNVPVPVVDDCCTTDNEMWIADVNGTTKPYRMLRGQPDYWHLKSGRSELLAGFALPQFSRDGKLVFFETQGGADASAYYSLNLHTGFIAFLYFGDAFEMIKTGKYTGYILASVFMPHAETDTSTPWLLNPQGRLLRSIKDGGSRMASHGGESNDGNDRRSVRRLINSFTSSTPRTVPCAPRLARSSWFLIFTHALVRSSLAYRLRSVSRPQDPCTAAVLALVVYIVAFRLQR
jgi:hypothetical protein